MKVTELSHINRIENNLHYIRRYEAQLHFNMPHSGDIKTEIRFSIEHDALGKTSVFIDFVKPIDYPLIPARKKVTEIIRKYDKEGQLN